MIARTTLTNSQWEQTAKRREKRVDNAETQSFAEEEKVKRKRKISTQRTQRKT
jgi:hypothetical protein